MRLSAAAGPNTEQYLLVDPRTVGRQLNGNPCPLQRGGGPGPCGVYSAHVTITSGSAGAVFPGKAAASQMAAQRCPELTISPAMTVELWLDVFSTHNVTVSVVPFLTLSTSGGAQTLELPEAAGTIAFANMDQFYCYSFDPPTSKFRLTDRGENAIYRSCI